MRVISVLGPPHSGKTTLVKALSGLEGPSVQFKVSETVSLRSFKYLDEPWCAIDIAGGPDELARTGPALAASDAAVLCIPPDPEAAVLSAPYLRLIEEAGIPCFLFVNRMDMATDRLRDIVSAIQSYSNHNIVLRQVPIREDGEVIGTVDLISERAWKYHDDAPSDLIEIPGKVINREQEERTKLLETLADFDIELLEQLIEDKRPATDEVFNLTARVMEHNDLCPAFFGVANHGNGVRRLMKSLRHEVPHFYSAKARLSDKVEIQAIGFLADIKKHIGKLIVIRALGSKVQQGKPLGGDTLGGITDLDPRIFIGKLEPGQVGLALKSDHLTPNKIYTATDQQPLPEWAKSRPPGYRHIVLPTQERDDVRLSNALSRLAEIDPGLGLEHDASTGKLVVAVQGPLHARQLNEKLSGDFGIKIEEEPVLPDYRETISKSFECQHRHRKQSGGAGQFADVHIDVKPLGRGAGFQFEETVKGGAVPRNYIPSVAAGAEDALQTGPNGFQVVDLCVTLKDGKHHSVDSSDYAFRTAGKNAVREALQIAGTKVLQPIMRVDIHVPSIFAGGLAPTISSLHGQVLGFESNPNAKGWEIFSALLPASAHEGLFRALASATKGTAWAESGFDHYEEISLDKIEKPRAQKGSMHA